MSTKIRLGMEGCIVNNIPGEIITALTPQEIQSLHPQYEVSVSLPENCMSIDPFYDIVISDGNTGSLTFLARPSVEKGALVALYSFEYDSPKTREYSERNNSGAIWLPCPDSNPVLSLLLSKEFQEGLRSKNSEQVRRAVAQINQGLERKILVNSGLERVFSRR